MVRILGIGIGIENDRKLPIPTAIAIPIPRTPVQKNQQRPSESFRAVWPEAPGSWAAEAMVPPGIHRPRVPRFAFDGRLMQIFTKTVENRVNIEISKGISH